MCGPDGLVPSLVNHDSDKEGLQEVGNDLTGQMVDCIIMQTGSGSNTVTEPGDKGAVEEVICLDSSENLNVTVEPLSRQQKMNKLREERRKKMLTRKKTEFQPVEGEIQVQSVRRAETQQGQKLLDAMGMDRKLIQDRSSRMVVCGADVEALYPSLSDIQVAEIIYQAIMETEVGFDGVDYMEGCKYVAMNSTAQECRLSPLRRILPRRRHHNGVWPGVTGEDPMGPEVGNQDQWAYSPNVQLTTREKRMVVATVMKIAVLVLFRTHMYEFGGKFYL